MIPISIEEMADAIRGVQELDLVKKIAAVDSVYTVQPNLVLSLTEVGRQGVELAALDHGYHILLVLVEAFTRHGSEPLPLITEEILVTGFRTNQQMLSFVDVESSEERQELSRLTFEKHPEPNALAFVVGHLTDVGLATFSPKNELLTQTCMAILNALIKTRATKEGRSR